MCVLVLAVDTIYNKQNFLSVYLVKVKYVLILSTIVLIY